MNPSRRNLLKSIAPVAAAAAVVSGFGYLKVRGDTRIITRGDLNKYTSDGKFFIDGSVTNSPGNSGWLEVSSSPSDHVMQKFFDFNKPENILIRKKDESWSDWSAVNPQPQRTLPFSGKTVVCLGDSITGAYNYPRKMQEMVGGNIINLGLGGSSISQSTVDFDSLALYKIAKAINTGDWSEVVQAGENLHTGIQHLDFRQTIKNLSNTKWQEVDLLVAFYGTNDYGNNFKIGEKGSYNTDTVIGAINYSIKMILSKYPDMKILIATPMYRSRYSGGDGRESDEFPNDKGIYLADYVDVIIETARSNKIPYVDMLRSSGINRYNQQHMLEDGLHPSPAGEIRIAEKISAAIISNYS